MFALPFSYFLRKGYITLRLGVQLSGLFALGAGQGFIGWWMVKSGLEVKLCFVEEKSSCFGCCLPSECCVTSDRFGPVGAAV